MIQHIEKHRCFGGVLLICEHESQVLSCTMRFSIFMPPQSKDGPTPFITFLSGLTCTHENFPHKAGAYRSASQEGVAILVPDTSPRGHHVPDDHAYDLGQGAGFYINATQEPWKKHYRMESYLIDELNPLICHEFPLLPEKQGVFGHSMGGHGALTLGLKYPKLFKSISAFSPIVAASQVPWGKKAFQHYLGDYEDEWKKHDACALLLTAKNRLAYPNILIDQGDRDDFLETQLKPQLFSIACHQVGQPLTLRMHRGYDHSYYFIQSYIDDHIQHHARILQTQS